MNKKIISLLIIITLIVGGLFYLRSSNKIELQTTNKIVNTIIKDNNNLSEDQLLKTIDDLENEEYEINLMINELEELTF